MGSVTVGLGEWNSVEGGSQRGVGGMKKNKIGRMERVPKPEQTGGWLGWPTTCRGVSFNKGVGGRGQNRSVHPSTNYFLPPLFDRPIHRGGSGWKNPSIPCPVSYGKSTRGTSSRGYPRVDLVLLNRRLATEDTGVAHKRRKYHAVALGSLAID